METSFSVCLCSGDSQWQFSIFLSVLCIIFRQFIGSLVRWKPPEATDPWRGTGWWSWTWSCRREGCRRWWSLRSSWWPFCSIWRRASWLLNLQMLFLRPSGRNTSGKGFQFILDWCTWQLGYPRYSRIRWWRQHQSKMAWSSDRICPWSWCWWFSWRGR